MAFFVYEEYSAKYQEVVRAPKRVSNSSETVLYGKGTEALIGASNSWDNRGDYGKRAMELYDLLFKVGESLGETHWKCELTIAAYPETLQISAALSGHRKEHSGY